MECCSDLGVHAVGANNHSPSFGRAGTRCGPKATPPVAPLKGGRREGRQRSEVRSQRTEIRGQRPEIRGQKTEVRDQRSEARGQRTEENGSLCGMLLRSGGSCCSPLSAVRGRDAGQRQHPPQPPSRGDGEKKDRRQRTEDRRQRSEIRSQRPKVKGLKNQYVIDSSVDRPGY